MVIRRPVRTVILHGQAVDVPRPGGIRALADGKVEVILAGEGSARRDFESQDDVEPASRRLVEVAAWVGDEGALHAGRPVDRRRIAVERVEVDDADQRVARGVVDPQDVIHGLHDVAVARTQALVGRLQGELIAAIRQPLAAVVQALEADAQLRIGLRPLAARGRYRRAGAFGLASVDLFGRCVAVWLCADLRLFEPDIRARRRAQVGRPRGRNLSGEAGPRENSPRDGHDEAAKERDCPKDSRDSA